MKITEIRTLISWAGLRNWVLVKVLTDSGLYGWGEATLEGRERTVESCVQQFGSTLIGEDPLRREHHWQRLYRHHFWRGGPVGNSAIAALDPRPAPAGMAASRCTAASASMPSSASRAA